MKRMMLFSAILIAVCAFIACKGGYSDSKDEDEGGTGGDSGKAITAFSFTSAQNPGLATEAPGTISGASIAVTVPYGTTVTTLVATFTTTGASVKIGSAAQTSGTTVNDFSSAKAYTVTAADGSTQSYTVTGTVASASAKAITAFGFLAVPNEKDGYTGNDYGTTISGTAITVKLPYGSTSMIASFSTTGASVSVGGVIQTSGSTSNDFKNPVTYTVTAADGSTRDYAVTALFAPAVGCVYVAGKSSYWLVDDVICLTVADSMYLHLTCDAVNAGSDTFTMRIILPFGATTPHPPTSVAPYLTMPSETTATYNDGNERDLIIIGSLTSIQSVIAQLLYVPPTSPDDSGSQIRIFLADKNGLMAQGRLEIYINDPE